MLDSKNLKNTSKFIFLKVKNVTRAFVGYIMAIFSGILTIACVAILFEEPENGEEATEIWAGVFLLVVFLALTLWGIAKIIKSRKVKKCLKLFSEYSLRLSADDKKSLYKLATSMNSDVTTVMKNIELLLEMGLFPNAYIDRNAYVLVFPKNEAYEELHESKSAVEEELTSVKETVKEAVKEAVKEVENEKPKERPVVITVKCSGCNAPNKVVKGKTCECEYCGFIFQG